MAINFQKTQSDVSYYDFKESQKLATQTKTFIMGERDSARKLRNTKRRVVFRVETGECAGVVITVTLNERCGGNADREAVELLSKLDFCPEFPKRKKYNGSFAEMVSVEEVKE